MSAPSREAVTAAVHGAITTILPGLAPADIDHGRHLKELGADSVDRVEIILAVTDRLGVRRPLSDFNDIPTVGALIDHLCGVQP
ncbi:acyl carrier protein [Micromonospora sp. DT233]|uniref:acyl carrier protein n=1 Tax=Micromonospora sp. DT233 TaxID=3393432 RepID=UPI003CFB0C00